MRGSKNKRGEGKTPGGGVLRGEEKEETAGLAEGETPVPAFQSGPTIPVSEEKHVPTQRAVTERTVGRKVKPVAPERSRCLFISAGMRFPKQPTVKELQVINQTKPNHVAFLGKKGTN